VFVPGQICCFLTVRTIAVWDLGFQLYGCSHANSAISDISSLFCISSVFCLQYKETFCVFVGFFETPFFVSQVGCVINLLGFDVMLPSKKIMKWFVVVRSIFFIGLQFYSV
jgi:hypothetical protein